MTFLICPVFNPCLASLQCSSFPFLNGRNLSESPVRSSILTLPILADLSVRLFASWALLLRACRLGWTCISPSRFVIFVKNIEGLVDRSAVFKLTLREREVLECFGVIWMRNEGGRESFETFGVKKWQMI